MRELTKKFIIVALQGLLLVNLCITQYLRYEVISRSSSPHFAALSEELVFVQSENKQPGVRIFVIRLDDVFQNVNYFQAVAPFSFLNAADNKHVVHYKQTLLLVNRQCSSSL